MAITQTGTGGIKDDAVTAGKIPANAVGSSEIADTAVTLAKLEHGTSSNDGKFLRANNGADPTFETVSTTPADGSITTAKLADNSVDKDKLAHGLHLFCSGSDKGIILQGNIGEIGDVSGFQAVNDAANANTDFGIRANSIRFATTSAERVRVTDNGLTFNGDTAAANALDDYETGTWTPAFSGLSNTPVLSASGKYVKVGSIVYASAYMQSTGTQPTFTTTGDPLIITGIPFTANGTGYTNAHGVVSWSQMDPWGSTYNETPHGDTTGHILVGLESGTNTVFYVSGANNTQRGRVKNNALHNSGFILEWSITYQTNS